MRPTLALLAMLWSVPAAALTPYLVEDINPNSTPASSIPESFETLGDVGLFVAGDGEHGRELWRSDGTAAGTYLLADACPGRCDSEPSYLAVTADRAWFFARDEQRRPHLWVTDGTRPGTLKLTAGPGFPVPAFRTTAEAGGVLYFATAEELWRTDGTPAGTFAVAGWPFTGDVNVRELTAAGGLVFFHVDDGGGRALWKSDGTLAGTVELAEVEPRLLRALGGRLYFFATTDDGTFLWRSDGTPAGTVPVTGLPDIVAAEGAAPAEVRDAAVHGDLLYFIADTGGEGQELWATDGTANGTRRLTAFEVPTAFFGDQEVNPLQSFFLPRESQGGRFVFWVETPQGVEAWITDGTPAATGGTRSLRVACPAPCGELTVHPFFFTPVPFGGRWLFPADDAALDMEPWVTDGTPAGTRLVRDICAGICGSYTIVLGRLGNRLLLRAHDARNGENLWITDGTPAGTTRLTDIPGGGPFPFNIEGAVAGGVFLFPAFSPATGSELWISDGTRAGTRLLVDIDQRRLGGSFPQAWMPAGDRIYFFADDGEHGYELWTSDGTDRGTRLVADLTPGPASSNVPLPGTAFARGKAFFKWAPPGAAALGLWRTDGTASGTFQLTPDRVGVSHSLPPVTVGNRVYFVASDEDGGEELWRTDGRGKGTRRVADLVPGAGGSSPRELTAFRGRLYFVADARGFGAELWRTDGTAGGTTLVEDIHPGLLHANPRLLTVHGDHLYFFAEDGEHGTALWSSDGTAAGTALRVDVSPAGATAVRPLWMVSGGGRLFFAVEEEGGASSLWAGDGTAAGTRTVASFDAMDAAAVFAAGRVFFNAYSQEEGASLWMSQGTEASTRKVLDRDGHEVTLGGPAIEFAGHLLFPDLAGRLWQSNGTPQGTFPLARIGDGRLGKTSNRVYFVSEDPEEGLELGAVRP